LKLNLATRPRRGTPVDAARLRTTNGRTTGVELTSIYLTKILKGRALMATWVRSRGSLPLYLRRMLGVCGEAAGLNDP